MGTSSSGLHADITLTEMTNKFNYLCTADMIIRKDKLLKKNLHQRDWVQEVQTNIL